MSHKLMEAMKTVPVADASLGCRLVLMWLSYRANDEGQAWPSQADIANATGISSRQVRRAIKRLLGNGCLVAMGNKQRGIVLYGVMTSGRTHDVLHRTQLCPTSDIQDTQVGHLGHQVGHFEHSGRTQLCPTKKEKTREDIEESVPASLPLKTETAQPVKPAVLTADDRKARAALFAALRAKVKVETVLAEPQEDKVAQEALHEETEPAF